MHLNELEINDPEIFIFSNVGWHQDNQVTGERLDAWWAIHQKEYDLTEFIAATSENDVLYLTGDSVNRHFDNWISYIKIYHLRK